MIGGRYHHYGINVKILHRIFMFHYFHFLYYNRPCYSCEDGVSPSLLFFLPSYKLSFNGPLSHLQLRGFSVEQEQVMVNDLLYMFLSGCLLYCNILRDA